jgi:hypothetical protein
MADQFGGGSQENALDQHSRQILLLRRPLGETNDRLAKLCAATAEHVVWLRHTVKADS